MTPLTWKPVNILNFMKQTGIVELLRESEKASENAKKRGYNESSVGASVISPLMVKL